MTENPESVLREPGPERDSGLLIRVWAEPDDPHTVRARCLSFEGDAEPLSWTTAAGEADVVDAVEQWVRARLRSLPSGVPSTGALG